MFKLMMKHTELKDLTFSTKEFNYYLKASDIRDVAVYQLVLRVKLFNKRFYIPLCGVK